MINYLYCFKRNYGRFIKACYDINRKYEMRETDNFAIGASTKRTAQKSRVHGSENKPDIKEVSSEPTKITSF